MTVILILVYITLLWLVTIFGSKRKIGGVWTLIIAFLFSPIIGLIVAACFSKKQH